MAARHTRENMQSNIHTIKHKKGKNKLKKYVLSSLSIRILQQIIIIIMRKFI